MVRKPIVLAVLILLASTVQAAYVNFEVSHVHPIDLVPSGDRLLALNTPDALLEVWMVQPDGGLVHEAAIPVGLEPVSVVARTDTEAWVVNNLSDSISIVDLTLGAVTRTLTVGDEPTDVAFAGGKAFVSVSSEDAVKIYHLSNLDAPPVVRSLFSRDVRALAVSNDGQKVYAVTLRSGNRTTVVNANVIFDNDDQLRDDTLATLTLSPLTCEGQPSHYPGLPEGIERNAHLDDPAPPAVPPVSLIVQFDPASGEWRDETGQDWTHCLRYRLPDKDLFVIDVATLSVSDVSHLGTSLLDVSVHPTNGKIYVANTDARNFVRFEHPLGLQGHVVDNQLSVVDPSNGNSVKTLDLNRHIARSSDPTQNLAERLASISQPGMMTWRSDGSAAYLTAIGSRKLFRVDGSCASSTCIFGPDRADPTAVEVGEGPTGVALLEAPEPDDERLYVLNRVSHSVTIVKASTLEKLDEIPLHDPSPAVTRAGRHFLYDAIDGSAHGDAACSSCHISGDMDGLAWDLGNPEGDFVSYATPLDNVRTIKLVGDLPGTAVCEPGENQCVDHNGFDPQKGPMVTQTLRGLLEPLHHRGDRATFRDFNQTFVTLLGAADTGPLNGKPALLTSEEMEEFRQFALQIQFPPNPFRGVDDTTPCGRRSEDPDCQVIPYGHLFPGNPTEGEFVFDFRQVVNQGYTCDRCHSSSFGTSGGELGGVEPTEPTSVDVAAVVSGTVFTAVDTPHSDLKVLHLRNLYEKFGPMLGPSVQYPAEAKTGFGFMHDGSMPDLFRLVSGETFNLLLSGNLEQQRRDLSSFFYYFPTGTKPAVGRQVTVAPGAPPTGTAADEALLATLVSLGDLSATDRHCELVASTITGGQPRRYYLSGGSWVPDAASDPPLSSEQLREGAQSPITFTCATLEGGIRLGADRDEDSVLNGDDCAPADSTTFDASATVTSLALIGQEATTLTWDDQSPQVGASVRYEVLGGDLSALLSLGLEATGCVETDLASPSYLDLLPDPVAGEGRYYIVRAVNPCGIGSTGPDRQVIDQLVCTDPP